MKGLLKNLYTWFVCQWQDGRFDVRLCYKDGSAIYLACEYVVDDDLLQRLAMMVTGGGAAYPESVKYPHLPQTWPVGKHEDEEFALLCQLVDTARPWSCRVIVEGELDDVDTFTTLVSRVFVVEDLSQDAWGKGVRFLVIGRNKGWPWW